jgi:ppGpp synthetase/RelA/SpoT-type nucleotidyltranferase
MPGPFSKSQIDKLGQRLRAQTFQETELTLLDEYRRSFGPAYDRVVEKVQAVLGVPVSGRPAKSTTSIIEKLNRESIRLSQIQDIAGCRVVVSDSLEQNRAVELIAKAFENVAVQDRRAKPSHGYRAVHVIIGHDGKLIELQIRTVLQQVWAELSEKLADVIDPSIKYGGGPASDREILDSAASLASQIEKLELTARSARITKRLREMREELADILRSNIKEMDDSGLEVDA